MGRVVVLMVVLGMVLTGSAPAGSVDILEIDPVGVFKREKRKIPAPHGIAVISRISDDEVVLFDTLYTLSDRVLFFSEDGMPLYSGDFQKGDSVAYLLNTRGEISCLFRQKT